MPENFWSRKTAVECFAEVNPHNLAVKVTDFSKDHEVFATQTHYDSNEKLWIAFIYYKVENDA